MKTHIMLWKIIIFDEMTNNNICIMKTFVFFNIFFSVIETVLFCNNIFDDGNLRDFIMGLNNLIFFLKGFLTLIPNLKNYAIILKNYSKNI
jgi:hypothetical protein